MKRLSRKKIYQDQWMNFFQDEVRFDNHTKGTYAWMRRKDGVVVVVVTSDRRILLNFEYRYVLDKYSWEVPGGGIDEGESPGEAVIRELREETGIRVNDSQLVELGEFFPLNSLNTEKVTTYMAIIKPMPVTSHDTEVSEMIGEQKFVTFSEALEMIDNGVITDAVTANALQMAIRRLTLDKSKEL
jgi:8-oxo-dGTP pyrophosphatase MutT (NUDIX family)